jgi:hypothetical protein
MTDVVRAKARARGARLEQLMLMRRTRGGGMGDADALEEARDE